MRRLIQVLLDVFGLYAALCVMLLVRYHPSFFFNTLEAHLAPFSIVFAIWLFILFVFDIYTPSTQEEAITQYISRVSTAVGTAIIFSVIFFYLFSDSFLLALTPKTNLLIFSIAFFLIHLIMRFSLRKVIRGTPVRVVLIGSSHAIFEIQKIITLKPTLYILAGYFPEASPGMLTNIRSLITKRSLIIYSAAPEDPTMTDLAYALLPTESRFVPAEDFYELLMEKVNLDHPLEQNMIRSITEQRSGYEIIKRVFDVFVSFILLLILLPLIGFIALLIFITSNHSVIYAQERTGRNDRSITIYKFRTMRNQTPDESWSSVTLPNDKRVTILGAFLRRMHLDELTQLWNVLVGDISLVGPRPESSDLVKQYRSLPHYNIRHTVTPGITGWAQIKYKPSTSYEEAYEKLKYDIYYIKHRSFFFDLYILFKTFASILVGRSQ